MSFDKAIESGKEHRKQYRGAKRVAPSCRNHGDCGWCEQNRTYRSLRYKEKIKYDLKEIKNEKNNSDTSIDINDTKYTSKELYKKRM